MPADPLRGTTRAMSIVDRCRGAPTGGDIESTVASIHPDGLSCHLLGAPLTRHCVVVRAMKKLRSGSDRGQRPGIGSSLARANVLISAMALSSPNSSVRVAFIAASWRASRRTLDLPLADR